MPIHVVVDDTVARLVLLRMGKRARDLRSFFRGVVDPSVTEWLKSQFESEGRAGGSPWAPVRPLTVLLRNRPGHGRGGFHHGFRAVVGQDVRRMWASFTKSGGPDSVRTILPQFYERGSSNKAAHLFHSGYRSFVFGHATGRRVPARPIIPDKIPSFLTRKWERSLVRHLEGGVSVRNLVGGA